VQRNGGVIFDCLGSNSPSGRLRQRRASNLRDKSTVFRNSEASFAGFSTGSAPLIAVRGAQIGTDRQPPHFSTIYLGRDYTIRQ
jgi:hypothetical protein